MTVTQTESGKAWEYGLAIQCADLLSHQATLVNNRPRDKSRDSYNLLRKSEQRRISTAAAEAVLFLRSHDDRLPYAERVIIQRDPAGRAGDVRDLLIETPNETIGISAKHRHDALKHSRLSDQIDFGKAWYGRPCSNMYWREVHPIFNSLSGSRFILWRDLPDKEVDVYLPILSAFIDEVKRNADPREMMRYLLGRYDFYKVIKVNGNISLQSFNMSGSLEWGRKVPLPTRIIEMSMKEDSFNTAIAVFNNGWQVSFRIHNASSRIEPSLKFDVRLVGSPDILSRHEIPYR